MLARKVAVRVASATSRPGCTATAQYRRMTRLSVLKARWDEMGIQVAHTSKLAAEAQDPEYNEPPE